MKRHTPILAALPMLFWIGQGCSSNADTTGGDTSGSDAGNGGSNDDGGTTGPGTDGGGGGSKDSGGADGGNNVVQTTPGTSILAKPGITLYGVTSDGYVVYGQPAGMADGGVALTSLEVISLTAGAKATVIAPVIDFSVDDFTIAGMTIAYFKTVDQTTGIAANLSVWTAANGLKAVATKSIDTAFGGIFDASADGTHVVFAQNATATTADLVAIKPDGVATATTLVTGLALDNPNCSPDAQFRKAIVFATSCAAKASTTATIATLDTGNAAATVTKTAGTAAKPNFASMDANGTHLLYIKNTNTVGTVATFDGKTPVSFAQTTAFAALNTDASKLLWRTTAGELDVSPAATNTPTKLVATGVMAMLGVAPDFSNGVVALKAADVATNKDIPRYDLNFASLTTAGAPAAINAAGLPVGFNSTASHFFYMTDLPTTGQTPIATLKSHAAAGGADKEIAKNMVNPRIIDASTKVVYMENIQPLGTDGIAVDITVGDATAAAPKVVIQGADPGFEISSGKIIYTNAAKGLYVVPVP